jgi:CBS domain-containing protein
VPGMATYRMVYGDGEQIAHETFADVTVEREDGWVVLFRGGDAILRVRDDHVRSLERVDERPIRVRDLMRPPVVSVERDAHLAAAAYLMRKAGDTALVVVEDEADLRPVAVITDTDIAAAVADGKDPNDIRISDLPAREPITVQSEETAAAAANLMVASRIRHLPVVDGGRLVGMVDIVDACRGLMTAAKAAG